MNIKKADVLIIGGGLAGLMAAEILSLSKHVIIITKSGLSNSNSMLAQGGIAAAIGEEDDWTQHFFDTVVAGEYHNAEEATELLVQKGPEMIQRLVDLGVKFDRDAFGKFDLAMEGAHQQRRILHAGGDATGRAITSCLIERIRNHTTVYEHEMAVDLIMDSGKCIGVYTKSQNGDINTYLAPYTVLATGGAGGLYSVTSNDASVCGDGMALAYRAGALLSDMEFVQFHPTMLTLDGIGKGLISEAVRGEGATLVTAEGERIMDAVHPLKDLAPRDVVAREIHRRQSNNDQIYLDIRLVNDFRKRFPNISKLCTNNGVDLDTGLIPITPGAHFMMGGVVTDMKGKTTIEGLYAIGEVANTGVHGANRLASNSLLEGIVFASEMAKAICYQDAMTPVLQKRISHGSPMTLGVPEKNAIRKVMTENVSIVRNEQSLKKAVLWFENYLGNDFCNINLLSHAIPEIERFNMMTVGWLIATSALMRNESRGGHYRSDYPEIHAEWIKKRIIRGRKIDEQHQVTPAAAAVVC